MQNWSNLKWNTLAVFTEWQMHGSPPVSPIFIDELLRFPSTSNVCFWCGATRLKVCIFQRMFDQFNKIWYSIDGQWSYKWLRLFPIKLCPCKDQFYENIQQISLGKHIFSTCSLIFVNIVIIFGLMKRHTSLYLRQSTFTSYVHVLPVIFDVQN